MKISEASEVLGVSAETLRYYERAGLIGHVTRRSGGSRDYTDGEIDEVRRITELRRGGVPVEDIQQLRALSASSDKDTVSRFLEEKIDECHGRADDARRAARLLWEEARKWA